MKKIKYAAGVLTMLLCWRVAISITMGVPPVAERYAVVVNSAVDALPLPTEGEITGIDLMLFEPIPERVRKTSRARK